MDVVRALLQSYQVSEPQTIGEFLIIARHVLLVLMNTDEHEFDQDELEALNGVFSCTYPGEVLVQPCNIYLYVRPVRKVTPALTIAHELQRFFNALYE